MPRLVVVEGMDIFFGLGETLGEKEKGWSLLLEQQVISSSLSCLFLFFIVFISIFISHYKSLNTYYLLTKCQPLSRFISQSITHQSHIMSKINILILISLVIVLAACEEVELKYFVFTPQCYQSLIHNFNLTDIDCVKFTFSKLLGYGMVAGGAIVKIPQIIKILIDKSVYGISYSSILFELATNWITIVYSWYRGIPFSIYGENVFIGVQNILILLFFVFFVRQVPKGVADPGQNAPTKYMTYFLLTCMTVFLTKNPLNWPPVIIESSMILQILLFSSARIAQIIHIYRCKSTGSLALITCVLVVLGNLGRLFTLLVENGDDYLFITSVAFAFALNSFIVFQFFLYWNSGKDKEKAQ